ncbi:thermosome subunit alpha [Candidatus Nanohalobium constans]|uniref:Chaperonin GroEL, HSP60 family / thermosome subunit n=1 Tax=Candidatus Nanohalobium constans TaxID=2565781 RepID=A0A5Q0UFE7_9ARCH|nr:thermosome subunit alpha [Candidatus Nanohalobium constans]QGA80244.1 chaperonin GroEL, HSP60 family / thermosome subunit [Candidatus Nanohalobium constans]
MAGLGGQPVFIMSEDAERQTGEDAQENNINACKSVAKAVRTTLGPKGMDKMMVNSVGDLVVTNDGVTILDEMDLDHPAAKMMVEVAETQEEEVGDGTTTAVVLAGELLKQSEDLLDQEIHPTVITKGYRLAREKSNEVLDDIAEEVDLSDDEVLQRVAMTAMTGKSAETARDYLADIAVQAVKGVAEERENKFVVDRDMIKLEKNEGASVEDTELVNGVILNKEKVHGGMPEKVDEAKIALLDSPIEVRETETDAEINISDPGQMKNFVEQEEEQLKEMVESIDQAGANVVLCQKGIDDMAQHFLAKKGIYAVRRVSSGDMDKLAKATDANIVTSINEIESSDLGNAGTVEQRKVGGDSMTFVQDCPEAKSVSILIRGGTEHVVDEIERAMEDAIGGVSSALRNGRVVGGGGATEVELAQELRDYADSVGGREQLAINAFADALEIIPRTLAENAGFDPIDTLVDLRNKHDDGETWSGINVTSGKSEKLFDEGVVEPQQTKTQAVSSASEAAEMILRIDDVISASGMGDDDGAGGPPAGGPPGGPGGGMPGGMGGMM